MKKSLLCFTDGGCNPETGFAGLGIHIQEKDRNIQKTILECSDFLSGTKEKPVTNQVAELSAVTSCLKLIKEKLNLNDYDSITILSDSAYIVNCFKDKWYINWFKNNWKNSLGKDVANKELWIELFSNTDLVYKSLRGSYGSKPWISKEFHEDAAKVIELSYSNGLSVEFLKVKGHDTNEGNNRADLLATLGKNSGKKQIISSQEEMSSLNRKAENEITSDHLIAFNVIFKEQFSDEEKEKIILMLKGKEFGEYANITPNDFINLPELEDEKDYEYLFYRYICNIANIIKTNKKERP